MATSKGQIQGIKGHSPTGAFGHGGHHRKDTKPAPLPKENPFMANGQNSM